MKLRPTAATIAVLLLSACGETEEVRLQLTPAQRDEYRDIAALRIDSLRPVLDSICDATFEDRVAVATDSIVQRRLEEEVRLRARIGQVRER